jgi:serine/threonine-protein kinase
MTPLEPGQQLDHYHLEALAARSGMASIFRATDLRTGETVAIKVPHPEVEGDPVLFDRFQREASIGRELDHPGIMRVLSEEKRSRVYMVMEWVEGRSLRHILGEEGRLDEDRVLRIGIAVCDALDHIHSRGIVHRDLKPENVMIASIPGGGESIKLIDFGIAAKQGGRRLTFGSFSKLSGTADYIPPERVKGKRGDARSDLYSLGAMLYEMLSGAPPFEGPSPLAIMNSHLNGTAPLLSGVNPQVSRIVAKMMERDPERRYATAFELALDLDRPDQAIFAEYAPVHGLHAGLQGKKALFYSGLIMIPTAIFALLMLVARHQ